MTEQVFIEKFLSTNQPMDSNPVRHSCLIMLLKGARKLSGRNPTTGKYEMGEITEQNFNDGTYFSFQFTGLADYLILLEQIGGIFKLKGSPAMNKTNPIYRALKSFSSLPEDKIDAIRSLRNALAHNFGLVAISTDKKDPLHRKFTLSIETNADIIVLPSNEWDGNFNNKSEHATTIVHVPNLTELIEGIYQIVIFEHSKNNILLALNDGINELQARYTII